MLVNAGWPSVTNGQGYGTLTWSVPAVHTNIPIIGERQVCVGVAALALLDGRRRGRRGYELSGTKPVKKVAISTNQRLRQQRFVLCKRDDIAAIAMPSGTLIT